MDFKNEVAVLEYIQSEIDSGKLVLPTLPEVALSVRQAVNSGNASDAELARIISGDPGLAARLLQVANSPLYRARQKIESIQSAVTRMGHNLIRNIITSLAMQQIFKPRIVLLDQYFHDIWKHSVNVSAVARALCLRCGHLDKEQAMLAGLVHQIGKLPILTIAERFPDLAKDKETLDALLDHLHTSIGRLIMERWDFPESIGRAASEYLDFKRDSGPDADYVDLVQVAYLESQIFKHADLLAQAGDIPAFRKLGLDPEIEVLEIEGVAEEVAETEQIFL
jgi:HD-like signal output (HDOD) protein